MITTFTVPNLYCCTIQIKQLIINLHTENRSLSNIQQILADANLKNLQSDDDYLKRFLYSTSFDVQEAVAKVINC